MLLNELGLVSASKSHRHTYISLGGRAPLAFGVTPDLFLLLIVIVQIKEAFFSMKFNLANRK